MSIATATLDEFRNSLIVSGHAEGTAHKYTRLLANYSSWAAEQPERDTATQLMHWVSASRSSGQSASTVRLKLAAARAYGASQGLTLGAYRAPKLPPARPHPLPGGIGAVRAMLAAEDGAGRSAVALGGLAGLRVHESVKLTRKHYKISRSRRVLEVHGKGGKIRYIPVSAELEEYVSLMPESGRLVPISNSGARAAVTRIAAKAGVVAHDGGQVSSHDLRATFATEVYNSTGDIRLVQELLGHSSVLTTQVYVGIMDNAADRAVEFA